MSDKFNDSEEGKLLPGKSREYPFAVPENYFEMLPNRIIAKVELEEELKEFAHLSGIREKQAFEVPEDYFQFSENELECLFEATSSQQLDKLAKPVLENENLEDYFSSLDAKMAGRIEVTEELKEYKLLHAIDKKNNFAFDPEYFETIADRVKERRYAEKAQSSLIDRLIAYVLKPKMALAFSIVILFGAGLTWYYFQPGTEVISGDCKTLACLEKNELLNEQTIGDFNDENLYEMVDVEELGKQITSGDVTEGVNNDSLNGKQ
jgi:hypothetical protein